MSTDITKPYHPILRLQHCRWTDLENQIEGLSNEGEKGLIFEQFVFFYLEYFRDLYQIQEHYSPSATGIPFSEKIRTKLKLEKYDHGVDGVWSDNNDCFTAYQVKFRSQRSSPPANELASFWAEAEYADFRCVVANTSSLPRVADKKQNHIAILSDRFDVLDEQFFETLHQFTNKSKISLPSKAAPRPYQTEMIDGVVSGLKNNERGKLIAACGTGKTLVSLWVSERLGSQFTLFLAPSLALIRQTLEKWSLNSAEPLRYLCVCSDDSVDDDINRDEIWVRRNELDVPVTTKSSIVKNFLEQTKGKCTIFSTYQSLDVIDAAIVAMNQFSFDLIISDEAHRTAGIKESNLFSIALDNSRIPSKKRLFMTATVKYSPVARQ